MAGRSGDHKTQSEVDDDGAKRDSAEDGAGSKRALFPSLLVAPALSLRQSSLNAVARGFDASRTSSTGDGLLTAVGTSLRSEMILINSSAWHSRRVGDTRWMNMITTPCSTCWKTQRDYPECVSLSEVLHAGGCLRYRVSLLVFCGFFYCSTCEEGYMSDFFLS